MWESARTDEPAPDAVFHDLDAGELTAIWGERKLAVIIEDVPEKNA